MSLIYISPIISAAVLGGIAILALIVAYYALIVGHKDLLVDEAEDISRMCDRRNCISKT